MKNKQRDKQVWHAIWLEMLLTFSLHISTVHKAKFLPHKPSYYTTPRWHYLEEKKHLINVFVGEILVNGSVGRAIGGQSIDH